jgi:hypothetical protein
MLTPEYLRYYCHFIHLLVDSISIYTCSFTMLNIHFISSYENQPAILLSSQICSVYSQLKLTELISVIFFDEICEGLPSCMYLGKAPIAYFVKLSGCRSFAVLLVV